MRRCSSSHKRRHANHARHVAVLDRARERVAGELRQVSDLRAATQRRQKTGRELKRVMQRQAPTTRRRCVVMSKTDDSIETMLVRLRCESITPFGWPVVPEVKISEATLCACTRCGNRAMRSSSVCSSGNAKTSS